MSHITFRIEYATTWGERVWMEYAVHGQPHKSLPLTTTDGRIWTCNIEVAPYDVVTYTYCIRNEQGETVRALRQNRFSIAKGNDENLLVLDHWTERDIAPHYLHSAFTECVFADNNAEAAIIERLPSSYVLRMQAVPPPAGYRWAVLGSTDCLGRWHETSARLLQRTGVYEWSLPLEKSDFDSGAEYKYLLVKENADGTGILWEEGENRRLCAVENVEDTAVVQDDSPRISVPQWRGAGVVIPVFSLRSRGSQGIGDFGDLAAFVRWANSVGFSAVQILPINDTTSSGTWHDSYPYNGISVFALHPIYLDMREWQHLPFYSRYEEKARELNAKDTLDYEQVFALKMDFLSTLFAQEGRNVLCQMDYADFFNENRSWLVPYAHFSMEKANVIHYVDIDNTDFFYFTQYLLHRQMLAAHDVARNCGVILKGDIPIGVCRDSVPAMVDRRLFHFDGHAGAPPDAFATEGQNWGFPTYNWDEMAKDGYAWWKHRLSHMSNYFDAYRIDHVLGFFRIWEVPASQLYGLLGYFRPALPFTSKEVEDFGFNGDCERYAVAHVSATRFAQLQAEMEGVDLNDFLEPNADGDYELREEYKTQQQILAVMEDSPLRRLLLKLVCEVLFIKDPDTGGWHPRIGAQQTTLFEELEPSEREAFNRLHDNFFYFRHNEFWADKAMAKLPAVISAKRNGSSFSMLPCAEDLGMIPASVKGVLERLHILSLEIQRMPKAYGVAFGNPADNPYLSVATIATHDMPPLRLWWHEDRQRTQQFWNWALNRQGDAPEDAAGEVCEQVITQHLQSPSMLCLNALQDYLAIDEHLRNPHYEMEQINVPANSQQYWQYRMHLTLEDLVAATAFNEKIRNMVKASGR